MTVAMRGRAAVAAVAAGAIRVLVVDGHPHPVLCRGVAALLSARPGFEVVGECRDGRASPRCTGATAPTCDDRVPCTGRGEGEEEQKERMMRAVWSFGAWPGDLADGGDTGGRCDLVEGRFPAGAHRRGAERRHGGTDGGRRPRTQPRGQGGLRTPVRGTRGRTAGPGPDGGAPPKGLASPASLGAAV